ncbi:hypothetical protein NA57DRAFT_71934 [Rhizodiscina lignyota]|uniref:Uncharacterized protein n=1 Tax=Rhizodiscina lignyota TaxID=1504668 RepID=A0A9P4IJY6_9PEZI|nr:hypothetical protein NA57DRAFT_71934 [Rhizodiscina lignyota]
MKDYGWFLRGVQSAIFLYVSCGPCHDASYRRKRKKEAIRSRQEKEQLRADYPEALHQPSPFDINPYWQEEIDIGPGPPLRKAKRTGKASGDGSQAQSQRSRALTAATQTSFDSSLAEQQGKKIDLSKLKELDPAHIKEKWQNRHQRRDEENMSDEEYYEGMMDGESSSRRRPSHGGSSVAPGGWPTYPREKRKYRYTTTRAPPVNDLHPPIVVTPSVYRAERQWMKEGPPSAAFMNGKAGTRTNTPSRSESALSNRDRAHSSPRISPNLYRHVGQKALDEKVRRGETPEILPVSRGSSRRSPIGGSPRLSQENVNVADYAEHSTPDSSFEMQRVPGRKKRRPRALNLASSNMDSSESSEGETIITPTTTVDGSSSNVAKPEPSYHPSGTATYRVRSSHTRLTTILSSNASNSPSVERARSMSPQFDGVGNTQSENISPMQSLRSSPQPSMPGSPVPFKPINYSLESLPGSNVVINGIPIPSKESDVRQGRGKRQDSQLSPSRAPIIIKDSSLHVLQELVSPSTLLNSRNGRSPASAVRVKLPDDGHDEDADADVEDEDDDGWLWTETGERKYRSLREARDVRNRWSMDF